MNEENFLPPKAGVNLSAYAKKAETLFVNLDSLVRRLGIERVGFVTLTFADRVVEYMDASGRFKRVFNSTLKPEGLEFVAVPERQLSGRFHFHLVAGFPYDIRTGFDFAACGRAQAAKRDGNRDAFLRFQAVYCRSANRQLRQFWALLRADKVTRHGFGRCETLPVLSNAAALARYVGAYVTSAGRARLVSDKGMRSVRYSLLERPASCRWSWIDGNGLHWRRGCAILSLILELHYDNFRKRFGKKWAWHLKDTIMLLGQNFETAIWYASQVPEWANQKSRMLYLARVCGELSGVKDWLLPDVEFQSELDDNGIPL